MLGALRSLWDSPQVVTTLALSSGLLLIGMALTPRAKRKESANPFPVIHLDSGFAEKWRSLFSMADIQTEFPVTLFTIILYQPFCSASTKKSYRAPPPPPSPSAAGINAHSDDLVTNH